MRWNRRCVTIDVFAVFSNLNATLLHTGGDLFLGHTLQHTHTHSRLSSSDHESSLNLCWLHSYVCLSGWLLDQLRLQLLVLSWPPRRRVVSLCSLRMMQKKQEPQQRRRTQEAHESRMNFQFVNRIRISIIFHSMCVDSSDVVVLCNFLFY